MTRFSLTVQPQRCRCVANGGLCAWAVDPRSGEAMLCAFCLYDPGHLAVNSVPKRLPRRSTVAQSDPVDVR